MAEFDSVQNCTPVYTPEISILSVDGRIPPPQKKNKLITDCRKLSPVVSHRVCVSNSCVACTPSGTEHFMYDTICFWHTCRGRCVFEMAHSRPHTPPKLAVRPYSCLSRGSSGMRCFNVHTCGIRRRRSSCVLVHSSGKPCVSSRCRNGSQGPRRKKHLLWDLLLQGPQWSELLARKSSALSISSFN